MIILYLRTQFSIILGNKDDFHIWYTFIFFDLGYFDAFEFNYIFRVENCRKQFYDYDKMKLCMRINVFFIQ